MSEGRNWKQPFWKITLSTASEDWTGGEGGISGETHRGGKGTDGYGRSTTAATTSKRGGEIESERGGLTGGEAAGRRSGRDSQPRFADAKVEQTQTAISRETTIN